MNSFQSKLFEHQKSPIGKETNAEESDGKECTFCEIIRDKGDEGFPREILFSDNTAAAFLDKRPVFLGHTLVVPIRHYETILDLPKDVVSPLFLDVQIIAGAVKSALKADGVFIGINNNVSQSVPHLHIHILPRKFGDGLRGFFWPRMKYQSQEQMNEISDKIRNAIGK